MFYNKLSKYPDDWSEISRYVRNSTPNELCSLCWSKECKETHHALYKILYFITPRKWASGIFLFPLCLDCHDKSHKRQNWIQYKNQLNNKNTFYWWFCLLFRYWILKIIK